MIHWSMLEDPPSERMRNRMRAECRWSAYRINGKCEGMMKSYDDDEPPDCCVVCDEYYGFEREAVKR